jgi:hypothetical protein
MIVIRPLLVGLQANIEELISALVLQCRSVDLRSQCDDILIVWQLERLNT